MTASEIAQAVITEKRCPTDEEIEIILRDGNREEVGACCCRFAFAHVPLLRRFSVLDKEWKAAREAKARAASE